MDENRGNEAALCGRGYIYPKGACLCVCGDVEVLQGYRRRCFECGVRGGCGASGGSARGMWGICGGREKKSRENNLLREILRGRGKDVKVRG